MTINERVKNALEYLENLNFSSYTEFVQLTFKDGKFNELKRVFGEEILDKLIDEKLESQNK